MRNVLDLLSLGIETAGRAFRAFRPVPKPPSAHYLPYRRPQARRQAFPGPSSTSAGRAAWSSTEIPSAETPISSGVSAWRGSISAYCPTFCGSAPAT